jgi:membrane protease YdiL (CAAX protease family)
MPEAIGMKHEGEAGTPDHGPRGTVKHRWGLRAMALATILFFGGGGWLLIILQGRQPSGQFVIAQGISWHLAVGAFMGLAIAAVAWAIISHPAMSTVKRRYVGMLMPWIGSRVDRVLVSIAAGVGEEIFFRGALQHWLGIPITAVLFVAVHGYLDPRDMRISIYGIFMTAAMLLMGWVAEHHGLLAPIVAHTVIDIVLLELLYRAGRQGGA